MASWTPLAILLLAVLCGASVALILHTCHDAVLHGFAHLSPAHLSPAVHACPISVLGPTRAVVGRLPWSGRVTETLAASVTRCWRWQKHDCGFEPCAAHCRAHGFAGEGLQAAGAMHRDTYDTQPGAVMAPVDCRALQQSCARADYVARVLTYALSSIPACPSTFSLRCRAPVCSRRAQRLKQP